MVPNRRSKALPRLVALGHSALKNLGCQLLLRRMEMLSAHDEVCRLEPRLLGMASVFFRLA
jgi:hypothetical protein